MLISPGHTSAGDQLNWKDQHTQLELALAIVWSPLRSPHSSVFVPGQLSPQDLYEPLIKPLVA